MSTGLVIPDPDEIRPLQPIPQGEITRLINLHNEMLDLRRMALNRAIEIGFKLRCWHDLIPHGKWLKWCQANLPTIHERTIRNYIQLWDNNELIRSHFKSETVSDLTEVVGVREAAEATGKLKTDKVTGPLSKPPGEALANVIEALGKRPEPIPPHAALAAKQTILSRARTLKKPRAMRPAALSPDDKELPSAVQQGVMRSPEGFKEQQTLDSVYQLLCDDAPDVWERLCSHCKAILKGLEHRQSE